MIFSKNFYRKCLSFIKNLCLLLWHWWYDLKVRAHPDSKYFRRACKMQASVADFFLHMHSHIGALYYINVHMYTVHRIAKFLSRQIRWTCLDLIYFLIFIKSSTRCVFTVYLDENKELFKTICQNVCKIKISIFAL